MVKKEILLVTVDKELKELYERKLSEKYKIIPSTYFKNFKNNNYSLILIDCRHKYINLGIQAIKNIRLLMRKTNMIVIINHAVVYKMEELFNKYNVVDFIDDFYDLELIKKALTYYTK